MCLHNAVEVSSLTTYIKKFWTQVCGHFSKLTLHGTEKKCDCIFPDSKDKRMWGEEAAKGCTEKKTLLVYTTCDKASEQWIQTVGELYV